MTCDAWSSPLGVGFSQIVHPELTGAEHGVDGPGEFACSGDASDLPAETLLLEVVVLREPAGRRSDVVADDGADECTAEPPVGAGRDGAVANGPKAGLAGARSESCVADQVRGAREALDGQHLGGDEEPTVGPDTGDALEERHGRDLLADPGDASIETPDHGTESVDDGQVRAHEETLLRPEEGPGPGA